MPEQHEINRNNHGRPGLANHGHPGREQEHGDGHGHETVYEIVVDGTPEIVRGAIVTYEQVVSLAYPNPDQQLEFSVAYRKAVGPHTAGTLAPGGSVRVKKGTTFNVTATVKS